MRFWLPRVGILACACIVAFTSRPAAAQSCLPTSQQADKLVAWVRHDVAVADTTELEAVGLLPTPAGEVALITADSVCALAVQAFNSVRQPQWSAPPALQVYVVRAGASRFVVVDPAVKVGEWLVLAVFDDQWQFLAHYGS